MGGILMAGLVLVGMALSMGCGAGQSGERVVDSGEETDIVAADTVTFADAGLEAAVRAALDQPEGALTVPEVQSLTELDASDREIGELSGIEALRNLRTLDLSFNLIEDITPLAALTQLQFLDLDGNQVTDLTPLSGLGELMSLRLRDNRVVDLSPLLLIGSLRRVNLAGNPLKGASVEASLAVLRSREVEVVMQAYGRMDSGEGDESTDTGQALPTATKIVFSLSFSDWEPGKRDLFMMDADGSNLVHLTDDPGYEGSPVCCPDGRRILFSSGIPFSPWGNNWLIMELDSGEITPLLPTSMTGVNFLTWSPDGSRIAFVSDRDGGSKYDLVDDLFVMDATGGDPVNLMPSPNSGEGSPSWSPDGSRIAFVSYYRGKLDILAMDVEGTHPSNLTADLPEEFRHPTSLAWSPDGSQIAFISYHEGRYAILALDADGSFPRYLTTDLPEGFCIYSLAWSPDGRRLAFNGYDGSEDVDEQGIVRVTDIFTMNADGSGRVNLTQGLGRAWNPCWLSAP